MVAADTTGKITGSDGNLKARVDPALAAKYKADMEAKNKKDTSALDSALGIKKDDKREVGVPGVVVHLSAPGAPAHAGELPADRLAGADQ